MSRKIVVIGGGSSTFTPMLMSLLCQSRVLQGSRVTLMDVDAHRLQVMHRLCELLIEKEGADLTVESTTERRESLVGADFVICSIAVGSFEAWEQDVEIPGKYGIFMHMSDSVGPGGMMRAFRHIPVQVAICRELEEVSPDAWLLNYTNPATANTLAMMRESAIKVVGLCTCSAMVRHGRHDLAGIDRQELMLPGLAAGINHCSAVVELRMKDGRDALPVMKERITAPIAKWVLETYGVLPYCSDHWVEFHPFLCRLEEPYEGRAQGLKMQHDMHTRDMEEERMRARKWDQLVEQWAAGEGKEVSFDVLPESEGVEVVQIIEDLVENRNALHVVNVLNRGAIENLPADAVVEVSAVVGGYGFRPIRVGPLPNPLAAHLRHYLSVHELTVEAALSGDRKAALNAFLEDPHVSSALRPEEAGKMLDELLKAHAQYLPQFR